MGNPNSRRARRKHRGKYRWFYQNYVYVAGRWLKRTVTKIKTPFGVLYNEIWNEVLK